MKLYTRTGDDGSTGLFGGGRVGKDDLRVTAYGEVDEANAALGCVQAAVGTAPCSDDLKLRWNQWLATIQAEMFEVGADLATPPDSPHRSKSPTVTAGHVARLEQWIDEAQAATPELRTFVLPGGSELAGRMHVARSVVRRAERAVVRLSRGEPIGEQVVPYLNRVSDLLFAWARWANQAAGVADVAWTPPERGA